ncbi:MAG TPA: RsmE family RNA methyltransferase [Puia sp.]|jgi:16S rRNA (uracil1498-N3)-methyltransferase|nr:RsmE family RNA methyltransferase [Puia sp.]
MSLPYFYIPSFNKDQPEIGLDESSSRHIVQVLRMGPGEELQLTDGKGTLITAAIADANRKNCRVTIRAAMVLPPPERRVTVAISPLKNASRFEWFLEKATEIGVSGIIPLLCDRTERQHLRPDRLFNILVSALLQSRQAWLPVLRPATAFGETLDDPGFERRLIAWLGEAGNTEYPTPDIRSTLILIGPEGDFTAGEAAIALNSGYIPVTLGKNRLRTETAGVVAATLLCIG